MLSISDVDECMIGVDICNNNGECINTLGGFHCECFDLFNGSQCAESLVQDESTRDESEDYNLKMIIPFGGQLFWTFEKEPNNVE